MEKVETVDMDKKYFRVYATVDLDKIHRNVELMKCKMKKETGIVAVIKNRRLWTWSGSNCKSIR